MADEGAADGEEGFVDVVAAVIATLQAPIGVQPGNRALEYPAFFAEPRAPRPAVAAGPFSDPGCDAALPERPAVLAACRRYGRRAASLGETWYGVGRRSKGRLRDRIAATGAV